MREKVALRELPSILASFRKVDSDLCGHIERRRFRALLKQDYGVGDVDDKVWLRGVGGGVREDLKTS